MDHASEQREETDALEAIFPTELEITSREYPYVSLEVVIKPSELAGTSASAFVVDGGQSSGEDSDDDEPYEPTCTLTLNLPAKYPECVPSMELDGLDDEFDEETIAECLQKLMDAAEESLGMAMVFTLVSTLQEALTEMYTKREEQAAEDKDRARVEAEAADAQKSIGTPVTVENFVAWKNKFDAEEERVAKRRKALAEAAKRATGKQQFLADKSLGLDLADIEIKEGDSIAIDESLFDDLDDLDMEDDD